MITGLQKFEVSPVATENPDSEKSEALEKTIAPRESYDNTRKVANFQNALHESRFCFGNTWNSVFKVYDYRMCVYEEERSYTPDLDLFSEDEITTKRYISSND